jgi:glycyl-tRNA synthetase
VVGTALCFRVEEGCTDTVTVRERDSTEQVRVPVADLPEMLADLREGETTFAELDAPKAER